MASEQKGQSLQFKLGEPIIIQKGTRRVQVDHAGGRALIHFYDSDLEKSFTLNPLDIYFFKDYLEEIEKAVNFKNREAHRHCFMH